MKKIVFIKIIHPILLLLSSLFFDKKYLTGRYFDYSLVGWKWVWKSIWTQKVGGYNRTAKFPVSPFIAIDNPEKIYFDNDDLNNFRHFGCYYSNAHGGKIIIGKGTWIAPNVGIITTNHSFTNLEKHDIPKDVKIGENCWIGMNAVILPGVILGDKTIVGAGSVVTKSFLEGNMIIAGNPAKLVRNL